MNKRSELLTSFEYKLEKVRKVSVIHRILRKYSWRGWFAAGPLHPRLRKTVDFHDAENRQRPRVQVNIVRAQVPPSREETSVKIACDVWYPPIWCRTKKRYQLPLNVLGLQWKKLQSAAH
ncbi:hypothetical protein TNCV_4855151 [Trichonephila clavipes]|nr:hypothetical protein TNCV_4855151 [Trichonephila clavipes]